MLLQIAILLANLPKFCGAGGVQDDFDNNLATGLAPILQIFGEQATKQFLNESTSLADNVIFMMVHLGILTAVVSAIRVWWAKIQSVHWKGPGRR
ncbi:hypothetical protein K469DRAFT_772707 [Zopfia rhizophila CBS 207.26]|uniref:Uncharacterized protein n=1 Tax=Zopfia rhizophila CBS 207.26 TaxID=1314779 RepID=A0A6A6E4X5_9PEZI|nr:hypothetical protein K469DRAFT_772707 [Zopfia rhizophila CBS 207.26]